MPRDDVPTTIATDETVEDVTVSPLYHSFLQRAIEAGILSSDGSFSEQSYRWLPEPLRTPDALGLYDHYYQTREPSIVAAPPPLEEPRRYAPTISNPDSTDIGIRSYTHVPPVVGRQGNGRCLCCGATFATRQYQSRLPIQKCHTCGEMKLLVVEKVEDLWNALFILGELDGYTEKYRMAEGETEGSGGSRDEGSSSESPPASRDSDSPRTHVRFTLR